jgi:hypothetical protein
MGNYITQYVYKYRHSFHCPDYDETKIEPHSRVAASNLSENEKLLREAYITWFGRLTPAQRDKAWAYVTEPNRLQSFFDVLGDKMALYIAAARAKFDLPLDVATPTFSSDGTPAAGVNWSNLQWCQDYFYEQSNKLLDNNNITLRSPRDLDRLWILFYVTGDAVYVEQIKKITTYDLNDYIQASVIIAAQWSYTSHSNTGRLATVPPDTIVTAIEDN